ncbi:hypothetical protein EDD18DRAFT_1359697 [Armillaria luteobubalina]|uniref:Uncharacterized protein n=1 Tax=Armillaria luteobubalina TaxID=153913 RepID=A0AA39PRA4_9AGAR|nr:hypothetical protein EDD18DRAFT_1359697 [Armillaria luteobubalina]
MPEIRELFFFFWVIKDFIDYSNRNSLPLNVLQLWVDAKKEEEKGIIPLPDFAVADATKGNVFPLTKSMAHLTRGSKTVCTPIFPSALVIPSLYRALQKDETELDICPTAGLCLQNVIKHPRMVCLDLQKAILYIQVLVHCSPNIYTINDWNETIQKVDKGTCKFKIILALQFKFHVLAFGSYDNNFYWFPSPAGALKHPAEDESHSLEDFSDKIFEFTDPLTQFHAWLAKLVEVLEAQRLRKTAEIKCQQQEVIDQVIGLRAQGDELDSSEKLKMEEMMQKEQSVAAANASQTLKDGGKSSKKKESKGKKVNADKNGEQSSKQKPSVKKDSKTVAPHKSKKGKKSEKEMNVIDTYLLDSGDSKSQNQKAVTLPAPPPLPKRQKTSPVSPKSLNPASSAMIHASEPIFTFIKRSDSPFEGVGVYSCAIILHNSGIPPLTKAEEVLNCPGRLARLIESYFNFMSFMKSKKDAEKHHRLTINATEKEKLESLSVHGKDKCYVSQRHAYLIKLFNSVHGSVSTPFSSSGVDFYDPFEPAYISDTLSLPGHLGHLIFGNKIWKKMCPSSKIEEEIGKDPLSQYFNVLGRKKVKLLKSKYLDLECYDNTLQVPTKKCHVTPYVYEYNGTHKQLWTVLDFSVMHKYENKDHDDRLLSTIKTTSDGWTVGPLDFCAVSLCVHIHGKEQLAICRADPQRLTPHDIQFVQRGFETRKTSQSIGHKAQVPSNIQSSWLKATEATHLVDQSWYTWWEELCRIELAEVDKEQAWQFAEEEKKCRATIGDSGKRQCRVKGVQLKK